MPRQPTTAFGQVQTPHGSVLVRPELHWRSGRRGLRCTGAYHALCWLLPNKKIEEGSRRVFLLPPEHCVSDADLRSVYDEMVRIAQRNSQVETQEPRRSKRTVDDILDLIRVEACTLRPSTLVTYEHEWKGVLRHFPGETPLTAIAREDVQEMIADKIADGLSPATIRKHLVHLKRILNRALEEGVIGRNPCVGVKLPRKVDREVRFLDEHERQRLVEAAQSDSRDSILLVANGIYLGLRKAELLSLDWRRSYDFTKRVAHVKNQEHFTTKSGSERTIPMCEEFIDLVMPYFKPSGLVLRPDKPYVEGKRYRWNIEYVLDRCCAAAKVEPIHPHILRHTFASIAAQRGVSLYKLSKWMGHTLEEVTERYAHLCAYDDEINKLNGRPSQTAGRPHLRIVK